MIVNVSKNILIYLAYTWKLSGMMMNCGMSEFLGECIIIFMETNITLNI